MAIKDLTQVEKHLFLCNGGTCKQKGAEESTQAIRAAITANGIDANVHTTKTLCNGRCKDGPVVIAQPEGIWFKQITPEAATAFVDSYLLNNTVLEDQRLYQYGEDTIAAVEPAINKHIIAAEL